MACFPQRGILAVLIFFYCTDSLLKKQPRRTRGCKETIFYLFFFFPPFFFAICVFSGFPEIVELQNMVAPSNIDVCYVCCPHTSYFIFSSAAPRVNVDNFKTVSIPQKFYFFLQIHKKPLFYYPLDLFNKQTHVFGARSTQIHHVVRVFF